MAYIYIYDINDLLDSNVLKRMLSDLETVQSMSSGASVVTIYVFLTVQMHLMSLMMHDETGGSLLD